jgi:hypothetical protein
MHMQFETILKFLFKAHGYIYPMKTQKEHETFPLSLSRNFHTITDVLMYRPI